MSTRNDTLPARIQPPTSFLLVSLILALLVPQRLTLGQNHPPSIENQWKKLPEITTKPESGGMSSSIGGPAGSAGRALTLSGGNTWRQTAQQPQTVPVEFYLEFMSDNEVASMSLGGKTVSDRDPFGWEEGYHPMAQTPSAVVNLKPNQTYTLKMWGTDAYQAFARITPPSLSDIFATSSLANQPARVYSVYYFDPEARKWQRICPNYAPRWDGTDHWLDFSVNFQIQVRPDLGARPVTTAGQRTASGDDQGDDAWTRDEPAIDAATAPGDATPPSLSSSRLGDPASARFSWAASLGRLWTGANAGRITFDEYGLGTNVCTPAILNFVSRSADTNEVAVVMDLDDTNSLSQIKTPQTLASIEPLYGSALFLTNDFLNARTLAQKLTNGIDLLSGYLWTNLSSQAQQTLVNTNSTEAQLKSAFAAEFNTIIQNGSIFEANRFAGVGLSGRTRRLLIVNPTGTALVRLNRFLLEDAYPSEIARLQSTQFNLDFYLADETGGIDALGFFTTVAGATPFVTWQMGQPEGNTNQWFQREIRNDATNSATLVFSPASNLWTLTRGAGNEARVETRAIVTNSISGTNFCTETQEVKTAAGAYSDRTVEVYQQFDWGYELVAATNDPGGANLVTLFSFNPDTNQPAGGKIASIVYPDGFWEKREYSQDEWWDSPLSAPLGALVRIVQPWKDSPPTTAAPDCLITDYAYMPDASAAGYKLVKWHDPTGQREWYAVEDYTNLTVRADIGAYTELSAVYQDPCADQFVVTESRELGNLEGYGEWQDTTTYGPYAGHLAGHLYLKGYDLTRADVYDYEFGSWNPGNHTFTANVDPFTPDPLTGHDVRQTIYHGLDGYWLWAYGDVLVTGPSGGGIAPVSLEPFRTTMEVRVIHDGNLAAKEQYVYVSDYTNFALFDQLIYQRDTLGHATNVFRVDPQTQESRLIYSADWTGSGNTPADLKLSETDEDGTEYVFSYDSLNRLRTRTKQPGSGQSPIVDTFAFDAANRIITNTVSAGTFTQSTVTHYDLAGRKQDETGPDGLTTTFSYQNGGRQTTITQSSGATTIISNYLDRRVASITGSAVTNRFFDYSIDLTAGWSEDTRQPRNATKVTYGTTNSLRWTSTYTDHKYAVIHEVKPAFRSTNSLYKSYQTFHRGHHGRPDWVKVTGLSADGERYPGGPEDCQQKPIQNGFATECHYDYYGQRVGSSSEGPHCSYWNWWDPTAATRITTWTNFYELDPQGAWFHVSEKWLYPFDNSPATSLVERKRVRLTGFTSTALSEEQTFDADTNQTTAKVIVDLAAKKLTLTRSIAQSSLTATQIVVNGLLQSENTTSVARPSLHFYDALGRETGVRDPLGNYTATAYNPVTGQVTSTTDPRGQVTSFDYYPAGGTNAGLLRSVAGPTGKKTLYNYNGAGQITHTWGDVPYPEKREYNVFGDQVTLTTYRGGTQWSGSSWPSNPGTGDVTQWFYDEATGLLTNKTDAAGRAVTFDYYDNYYLKTRVWARGVACTNIYDEAHGELLRIDYSDGTFVAFTNDTLLTLNRLGKPSVIIDAAGTSFPTYDHAGREVATVYTSGLLAGVTLTNHIDPVYGRDFLQVQGITPAFSAAYDVDAFGRLNSVSSGIYSAEYGYLPNSDLLQSTTSKRNGAAVLTATRTWETGLRLRSIVNTAADGTVVTSHAYRYDALNRRKQAQLEDASTWNYDYNDRNELTAARRYWSDWSPVSGQQVTYDFDNIGNRKSAGSGGDTSGCNLRQTTYTANSLNQYSFITNAGFEDIIGVALATNVVGVTNTTTGAGALADRKVEYFHSELAINNSSALWQTVAVGSGGSVSNGGFAFPAANQSLIYDWDGNLTSDGVWTYEWDPENRLAAMSMAAITGVPSTKRLRLEFVYDYQGRRIQKQVFHWNSGSWTLDSDTRFVYDGWNLLATLNPQLSALNHFAWGLDLSGSEDGAGGIGGLLAVFEIASGQSANCHFAGYDGNGNVTALVRASDLATSARYEFSPFGETLRSTGPLSKANPFRFSTKLADDESGLLAYPKRFYIPALGRWGSRDPEAEEGGINLFAFVANSPLNSSDPLGTSTLAEEEGAAGIEGNLMADAAGAARQAWSFYDRVQDAVDAFNTGQQLIGEFSEMHKTMGESDPDEMLMEGLYALGGVFGSKMRGTRAFAVAENHHIATDKSIKTGWTGKFGDVFKRCGNLSLQDKENIILSLPGHKGRHATKYHALVWDTIRGCRTKAELITGLRKLRKMLQENSSITQGNGL